MRAPSPVFANARVLFLTEIMNVAAGIVTVILLARLLDVAALGLFSFSYSLGAVVAIACLYGSNQLIVREAARAPEKIDSLLGNSVSTRAAVGLALMLALEAVFLALGYSAERVLIITLLVTARLFDSIIFMLCSFFRGRQEMGYEGALRVCLNALALGAGLPTLVFSRSLLAFSAVQCAASLLVMLVAYRLVSKRYASAPLRAVTWSASVALFKEGLDFSMYGILLVIFLQTNTILLSFFKGDEATGLYTAGYRFVSALGMAALSVSGAVYPALSGLSLEKDAERIRGLYLRCLRYLWVLAAFCAMGLFLFAPEILSAVYGSRLLPAAAGLRVMSFTVLFGYANSAATSVLFSVNREKAALRALAASTVFVFIVNLLLLPRFGALGASVTTVLPEILSFALLLGLVRKTLGPLGVIPVAARFALTAAATCAAAYFLAGQPVWLRVAGFIAAYAAGLLATGLIGAEELEFVLRRPAGAKVEAANA